MTQIIAGGKIDLKEMIYCLETAIAERRQHMATTAEELHSMIDHLSAQDQERMLEYARELVQPQLAPRTPLPPGSAPEALLRFIVPAEVGDALEQAHIESEKIDPDEHPF